MLTVCLSYSYVDSSCFEMQSTRNNEAVIDCIYKLIMHLLCCCDYSTHWFFFLEQYNDAKLFPIQFQWWRHIKHHVTHSVCVHDARKCLLCIFVSLLSFFTSSSFPLYPLYHHFFLHLSILAPVGIGKRCSNLTSMILPSHGHRSVNSLNPKLHAYGFHSKLSISMSHLSYYTGK